MFDFLRSIDLSPMEWTTAVELTGEGSPYIGQILDAAFGRASAIVVLMTPDEVAYLQPRYAHGDDDPETHPSPQARPNVLFEAGMALGRDSKRTVLVEVGAVRPFSDVAGRHAIRLDNSVANRQALAKRLETAGCEVNLTGTDWHTAGDFDKLQVINRGTETAYDIKLAAPENAALQLLKHDEPIAKIPGGGKAVTIDAMDHGRNFGGPTLATAFDVTVSARTEAGDDITQEVFLDMNG